MSNLSESIIAHLETSPDFGSVHIGEEIPQDAEFPYVWLMRSNDEQDDSLCHPNTSNSHSFNLEVVSDDIAECREVTAQVKAFLRTTDLHSVEFENDDGDQQTIHCFDVEDHDDDYLPRSVDSDDSLHVGSIRVRILTGELV